MQDGFPCAALRIVQRAKSAQALRGQCARLVQPLFVQGQLSQQTQRHRRVMMIADAPMLDQGVVEEASRGREVELFQGTLAGMVNRRRGVDHAPRIDAQLRALQEQALRFGMLTPIQRGPPELHERERFELADAGHSRQRQPAQQQRLETIGTLRMHAVAGQPQQCLRFAAGVAEFLCQRDGFAEKVVAALRMRELVGGKTRSDQRIEAHLVALRVQGERRPSRFQASV